MADKPGTRYDHAGVDRQAYEDPVCGSNRPHDPHMYSPMASFTVNCAGKAAPMPVVISLSDLTEALAGLDLAKGDLSYDETAELIMTNYAERGNI